MRFFRFLLPALFAAAHPGSAAAQADAELPLSAEERSALDDLDLAELFRIANENPEVRQARAEFAAHIKTPGEQVPNWSAQGVDIEALMRAMEAERGSAYFFDRSGGQIYISYDGRPQRLLDATYARHTLFESEARGEMNTALIRVSPGIWLEAIAAREMIGHGACNGGMTMAAIWTNRPVSTWSEPELGMAVFLAGTITDLVGIDMCTVYYENRDGGFRTRNFQRDGTSLPQSEDPTLSTMLIDRQELDRLLEAESGS